MKISLNIDTPKLIETIEEKLKNDFEIVNTDQADWNIYDSKFLINNGSIKNTASASKTIIISDNKNDYNIEHLLAPLNIDHIIGANSPTLLEELYSTINNDNLFSILESASQLKKIEITSSKEITNLIIPILQTLPNKDYFSGLIDYIKLVANELITNAIYNAPTDSKGLFRYQTQKRTRPVILADHEQIIFKAGTYKDNIVFSVKDPFGSLTKDRLISSLIRSAKEKRPDNKEGGAGLGSYFIYNYSNQIYVRSIEKISTEVICIIDKTKRFKQFRERITSFHFLKENKREQSNNQHSSLK